MLKEYGYRVFGVLLLCLTAENGLLASCPNQITVVAHRGDSSQAPENTLASFQSAIDMKADYIELDVHLSLDDVVCVIHDPVISRTTNATSSANISELTITEMKALDAGGWFDIKFRGECVPTLKEVLDLPLGDMGVFIEIKQGSASPKKLVEAVAQLVREYTPVKRGNPILIGSFSFEILREIRALLPEQTIISIVEDLDSLRQHKKARPAIYAVSAELLSNELIEELHNESSKIWTFTVDTVEQMSRLIEMGVDGIITNRPKQLISLKEEDSKRMDEGHRVSTVVN